MPDITTPQVVRFSNERARVFCDAAEQLYLTAQRFQSEWAALVAGFPVPSTTDNVADGSDVDGRKRITGQALNGLKTAFADPVITWFEGASGFGTLSRIDVIRRFSVNGAARF
jgi:hypothetical protein